MRASTSYLRAILRGVCWSTEESGKTLEEALKGALIGAEKPAIQGKELTHSSVGSQSVSYQILAADSALNSQDIYEAWEYLYSLYQLISCELAGDPAPTDAEICSAMIARLQGATRVFHDFSATVYR